MGNFEKEIPKHIKHVQAEIQRLRAKERSLNWGDDGHDCDCEYCTRRGKGRRAGDPDVEKKAAKLDEQIASSEHLIDSLKTHARIHGVKLETAKT